jgi:hypothetical protein
MRCTGFVVCFLLVLFSRHSFAQLTGTAELDIKGITDHSGIMVTFWDEFTFEVKDTAYTFPNGQFELDLKPGNYYVFYDAPGFKQYRNPEAFEHKNTTQLAKIKLKPAEVDMLNGKRKWNPYGDKCVCNRPQHHTGVAIPGFGGN